MEVLEMLFDNATWWLAVLLLGALIATAEYLLKRSLFGRIDEMASKIKNIMDNMVKKADYEKAHDKALKDIEQIKKDYTPRNVHNKAFDEVRADIKKITENYLTKEDFFREQAKTERKLDSTENKIDRVLEILMNNRR
jgi:lipoate-protein ligase A